MSKVDNLDAKLFGMSRAFHTGNHDGMISLWQEVRSHPDLGKIELEWIIVHVRDLELADEARDMLSKRGLVGIPVLVGAQA